MKITKRDSCSIQEADAMRCDRPFTIFQAASMKSKKKLLKQAIRMKKIREHHTGGLTRILIGKCR